MNVVEAKVRLAGRFRLEVRDGETLELTRPPLEFDNLILNTGLEACGTTNVLGYVQVGTSNTPPHVAQSALVGYVAGAGWQSWINGPTPVAPDYVYTVGRYFRFAQGAAAGNLSEIGVGWGASGTTLFSRALIIDDEGDPTTITVLPTEVLDVYYYLDVYPDLTDKTFDISIAGVLHSGVIRWANATDWTDAHASVGFFTTWSTTYVSATVTNGVLGPVTGAPTTPQQSARSASAILPYVANSRRRDIVFEWGLNTGNLTGGISAVWLGCPRVATMQASFSPPIAKTNTKVLTLTYRVSWDRR